MLTGDPENPLAQRLTCGQRGPEVLMSSRFLPYSLALLAVADGLLAQSAKSALDPGALYKQASPAVVLIDALGVDGKPVKSGSGLLVSADGKLLTNYHVISHA